VQGDLDDEAAGKGLVELDLPARARDIPAVLGEVRQGNRCEKSLRLDQVVHEGVEQGGADGIRRQRRGRSRRDRRHVALGIDDEGFGRKTGRREQEAGEEEKSFHGWGSGKSIRPAALGKRRCGRGDAFGGCGATREESAWGQPRRS
jgi:hypothetical protein